MLDLLVDNRTELIAMPGSPSPIAATAGYCLPLLRP